MLLKYHFAAAIMTYLRPEINRKERFWLTAKEYGFPAALFVHTRRNRKCQSLLVRQEHRFFRLEKPRDSNLGKELAVESAKARGRQNS